MQPCIFSVGWIHRYGTHGSGGSTVYFCFSQDFSANYPVIFLRVRGFEPCIWRGGSPFTASIIGKYIFVRTNGLNAYFQHMHIAASHNFKKRSYPRLFVSASSLPHYPYTHTLWHALTLTRSSFVSIKVSRLGVTANKICILYSEAYKLHRDFIRTPSYPQYPTCDHNQDLGVGSQSLMRLPGKGGCCK